MIMEKKQFLACAFCRQRKIACRQRAPHCRGHELPEGPRTCNQCARRGLVCSVPNEARRGIRRPKPVSETFINVEDEELDLDKNKSQDGMVLSNGSSLSMRHSSTGVKRLFGHGLHNLRESGLAVSCLLRPTRGAWALLPRRPTYTTVLVTERVLSSKSIANTSSIVSAADTPMDLISSIWAR